MTPASAGRPNIVFIMTDDHAAHAISSYGSVINKTPHLDRLAAQGMRFDHAFCTNAICSPSRAAILTGTYNHINGVTTLPAEYDARQPTFPAMLREAGYQTALVGKWHLGHGERNRPHGFDHWEVLPDQGEYHDPVFLTPAGAQVRRGYVTDIITDLATEWLATRDPDRPFCLLVQHKAPHRPWRPDAAHADLFENEDIPVPATYFDDYASRSGAAGEARMRVARDLTLRDLKEEAPAGLAGRALAEWKYQRYIKDYLRVVASVDDNVGRLLDWLDGHDLTDDTLVVYTSDQGFFLGDHGWFDKRFMYEESLRMPLLARWPRVIPAGLSCDQLVANVDLAQTFLDAAGVPAHPRMQGNSLMPLLQGRQPDHWRTAVYYRYWEHLSFDHRVRAHYGIRTKTHKLIYYYGQPLGQPLSANEPRAPEWELFDLTNDPYELCNRYHDPAYADVAADLTAQLAQVQTEVGDTPWPHPEGITVTTPTPAYGSSTPTDPMIRRVARPLALQLWTVREALHTDRTATLEQVRAMGFRAVEPFGVGERTLSPAQRIDQATGLRRLLDGLGLSTCAAHGRVPMTEEYSAVLDELEALGAPALIVPTPRLVDGCDEALSSADGVRHLADRLSEFAQRSAERGITVGYHNHWHEFAPLSDGRAAFDLLWEHVDASVVAEVDVYWAHVGGVDPADVVARLGDRTQLLHVKDGPGVRGEPHTALGEGVIDLHAVLAAGTHVAWHVVELDECATDVFAAIRDSARWLVDRNWSSWDAATTA